LGGAACRGDFAGRGLLSTNRMGAALADADIGYAYWCWLDDPWGAIAVGGGCAPGLERFVLG